MKCKYLLLLAATAMLASCGNNASSNKPEPVGPDVPPSATYLDWVADNKIVFDLFSSGDAQFAYGNAALTQGNKVLDLNASAAITCSTSLPATQVVNFVYVTETATGTGYNAGAALYAAIEGDKISGFLGDNDNLKGKNRAYVAISFGETVQWTKGKNAAMDAKIQALVDASK